MANSNEDESPSQPPISISDGAESSTSASASTSTTSASASTTSTASTTASTTSTASATASTSQCSVSEGEFLSSMGKTVGTLKKNPPSSVKKQAENKKKNKKKAVQGLKNLVNIGFDLISETDSIVEMKSSDDDIPIIGNLYYDPHEPEEYARRDPFTQPEPETSASPRCGNTAKGKKKN